MKSALTGSFLALFFLPLISFENALAHSPHDFVRSIAVSPDYLNDHTVFCSLSHIDNFILKSTDSGSTWMPSQIGFPHYLITSLRISPGFADDGIIYAGTIRGGIFRSTNRGQAWESINTGLGSSRINQLALSPDFVVDETLFAATDGKGVYKSNDRGASWQEFADGLTGLTVNDLAVSPAYATDKTVFCATDVGVFKSTDAGLSWFEPHEIVPERTRVVSIACSPAFARDQVVVAGAWGKGFVKSRDGGRTWIQKNSGIEDLNIVDVDFSPDFASDHTIVVASQEQVYKSMDSGNQWMQVSLGLMEKVPIQTDTHYFCISFSPEYTQDRTVFLGAWEGLHVSHNAAEEWSQLNVYNQNFIRTLTISSDYPVDGTVFGGAYGGGIYRTTNYGDSWTAKSTGVSSMHIASLQASPNYAQDRTVFAGIFPDVIKTTVGGMAWYDLEVDPANFLYARAMVISPDFAHDQMLFTGNDKNGIYKVYKTDDAGTSFAGYSGEFDASYCFAISPDFSVDQTLLTGTESGIFESTDGGESWNPIAFGGERVFSMAVSPNFPADGIVFAGVVNKGLYKSRDRGRSWDRIDLGFDEPVVQKIIFSAAFEIDGTLFCVSKSRGIFKSADGGDTWSYSGLRGRFLKSGVVSPDFITDQTLFIGGWGLIHRSTDGGSTWRNTLKIQRYDSSNEFLAYDGTWSLFNDSLAIGKSLTLSNTPLSSASLAFTGKGVSWIGRRAQNAGIASIFVDGVFQKYVNLYAPTTELEALLFFKKNLPHGEHTITILVTGKKDPSSTGATVFVDAFDIRY